MLAFIYVPFLVGNTTENIYRKLAMSWVLFSIFFFQLSLPQKPEGAPKLSFRTAFHPSRRHHEQSSFAQMEKTYGQEIISDLTW
jgi:hypothetical protein